ncbi:hypothetical protein ABT300_23165 [Streptomyces sp. NPDC001027]|uniref:hypothetical protein n=1 Tax=Streptomyces sp. NPDC001027 TaxID=3154771 RepID=UPI00331A697D
MLVSEFARFLGIPITARMNQAQITDAGCHLLCLLETKLVLVDDVHLLDTLGGLAAGPYGRVGAGKCNRRPRAGPGRPGDPSDL